MSRTELQDFQGVGITPDTAKALESLVEQANEAGIDIKVIAVQGGSTQPLGRSLTVTLKDSGDLPKLWSIAVPLGFTPWSRYPVPGTINESLYFLGPWQAVLDRLCAEGRGHLAWPAMCLAAALDTLDLEDEDEVISEEKYIQYLQAQLHRVGMNPGNLDGVLGTRTKEALTVLGSPLDPTQACSYLSQLESPSTIQYEEGPWRGQVSGHGLVSIATHGQVAVTRTATGAALTIEGPGRVIADFVPE